MLAPYTDNSTVRAVLGVSVKEIRDDVLNLPLYSDHLALSYRLLNPNIMVWWATITAILPADRTTAQAQFYSLAQLYAAYAVAAHALEKVEMFAPKKITDGSAAQERVETAWDRLRASVGLALARYAQALLAALLALDPTQSVPDRLPTRRASSNVGLASDPVLGT